MLGLGGGGAGEGCIINPLLDGEISLVSDIPYTSWYTTLESLGLSSLGETHDSL